MPIPTVSRQPHERKYMSSNNIYTPFSNVWTQEETDI